MASVVAGYVPISSIASLGSIPIGITSSSVGLKNWKITAGIQKIIKIIELIQQLRKKKTKHKVAKTSKINTIEVSISRALINSYIS